MSRSKNSGVIVELPDGRHGMVYHRDSQSNLFNGKVPVYTYDNSGTQADLFTPIDPGKAMLDKETKRILCDPKTLKMIGFFD